MGSDTPRQSPGLAQHARAGFEAAFESPPTAAAWAPGRVNVIGDHTDYAGGLALPIGLERGCVACAAFTPGTGKIHACALDLNETATGPGTPDELAAAERPGWFGYVGGSAALALVALREPLTDRDVRIAITSDVPSGSGLSSSAAVEVAVATAMEVLAGQSLEPMDKAKLCQRAEHRYAGTPCGLLDQVASIFATPRNGLRIDFADESVEQVPLPRGARFVLVHSGVHHDNTTNAYAERRRACESAAAKLGVEYLARCAPDRLAGADLHEEERRAAEHVISESERVRRYGLCDDDPAAAGQLMIESHASLRDVYRVSVPEVDAIVQRLGETRGVFGARMTGGGFGGCVVALVAQDTTDHAIATAVADIVRPDAVIPVTPGGGAGPVPL